MKEFVEKLIGRLEEAKERANRHYNYGDETAYSRSIEIVNELAEEYNNGWIPCSERLPESNGWYLVTNVLGVVQQQYWGASHWQKLRDEAVIAWMPLPEPYKEGSE